MNAGTRLYPVIKDLVNGRVFQMVRQEGADTTLPYIVYSPISSTPENAIEGFLGYEWVRVQIDFYHDDYDELDVLVNNAIMAINRQLRDSSFEGRRQLYENESNLYRQSIDFIFSTKV